MRIGAEVAHEYDLGALRFVASVGEPLNPEVVVWGEEAFGMPIHDNWWQTETGGIMIANYRSMDVRPGSMGRPLPGIEAAVAERDEDDRPVVAADGTLELVGTGEEGELVLRPGWPSMFRGYLHEEERYHKCFAGGWYLTGDLVRRDADGYFWFLGRGDDVIKSSGHLIGPFEVESVLLEHRAVAEAGVIGKPDPVAKHDREGVRLPETGLRADRRAAARSDRVRPPEARGGGRAAGDRVRRCDPAQPQRQDHASRAQGPRARHRRSATSRRWSRRREQLDAQSSREHGLQLLRQMLLVRRFEEKCVELYSATKIRGFLHLYIGEEAVAVGVMQALEPDDAIVATYREHGHALVRGVSPGAIMAEMYGKVEGCSRGRGGSMHLFDAATRFYGGNAIVAGGLPLALGLALADKFQGRERVTACFFGDGAVAEGEFHESMNLAALWNLPVLFCCENNLYAMGTAIERYESETNLALKAGSYEMTAWSVDGMDVLAVESAARKAVGRGPGRGPAVLPGAEDVSIPSAFDVRPGPVPHQGGDRALEAARPDPGARRAVSGRCRAARRMRTSSSSRSPWRRRSNPRSRSPRPAASSRSSSSRDSCTPTPPGG